MVLFDFWACFYPRKEASGGGKIAGPGEGMRGAANVIPPPDKERTHGGGAAPATLRVLLSQNYSSSWLSMAN